jgi:hypothetical protein
MQTCPEIRKAVCGKAAHAEEDSIPPRISTGRIWRISSIARRYPSYGYTITQKMKTIAKTGDVIVIVYGAGAVSLRDAGGLDRERVSDLSGLLSRF